jgi:SPP1 gp7 family putative phage head morphogenesis protein
MKSATILAVYVETVQMLAKSTGTTASRKTIRAIKEAHDRIEPKILKVILKSLRSIRNRFIQKFNVAKIVTLCERIAKASADDDAVRFELLKIIEASVYGVEFTDELVASLQPLIDELAHQFSDAHDVDLNFDMVNQRAVEFLRTTAINNFKSLSDDQANGIYNTIADAMNNPDGYDLKSIVQGIKDTFAEDTIYSGANEVDLTDWATMVARTETSRAASATTSAITSELGLQTWQWNTQDTGCDECDMNDGEVVSVGDDFPSGDSEPPAHPNCRCIVTVTLDELTSLDNTDEQNSEE